MHKDEISGGEKCTSLAANIPLAVSEIVITILCLIADWPPSWCHKAGWHAGSHVTVCIGVSDG